MFYNITILHLTAPEIPPIADAGTDIEIQLPIDFVSLSGIGSSDDEGVVRYAWTQTSGDGSAGMFGADQSNVEVVGLREGEYEFTLTVYDDLGLSDDDTVRVIVKGLYIFNSIDISIKDTVKIIVKCMDMFNSFIFFF